ncbi:hypothetical protein N7510_007508 [Penicillium lagena]|uniref:uncharacterized protein n=1 Tax=Penicillium lagena TaxID=94218 RepID=UPI0025425751|nr:uncharacterized protein N7510_007508 [Penicillium lagena]KAJ5610789.1 hypothetical protein N7510_007508 [Penicillium lagena]
MASLRKSYFLVPAWNIHPDEVALGSVVASPRVPLNTLSGPTLTTLIDTPIRPIPEKNPSGTAKRTKSWSAGLFATFLHVVSVGAGALFSSDSTIQVDYSCHSMTTRRFTPSLAYITKAAEDPEVKNYLDIGGLGAKVFMITGIKTVSNVTITTIEEKTKETRGYIGAEIPAAGVSIGPKGSHNSSNYSKHTRTIEGPIVFAFEVEKIRVNLKGRVVHKEYVDGAMLAKKDIDTETVLERTGPDLDEDEEDDLGVTVQEGEEEGEASAPFIFPFSPTLLAALRLITSAMEDPASSIADTAERARQLLLCCQENFSDKPKRFVGAQLSRFKLWASNIGVFSARQASLDYRLRTARNAKAAVDGNLEILCIQLLSALTGQEDLPEEIIDAFAEASPRDVINFGSGIFDPLADVDVRLASLQSAEETIGTLHQLSLAIRRASNRNSLMKVPTLYDTDGAHAVVREITNVNHIEQKPVPPVRFEVTVGFDDFLRRALKYRWLSTVEDENLNEDQKKYRQLMLERCIATISVRRRQLTYFQRHQAKLGKHTEANFSPTPRPARAASQSLHSTSAPRVVSQPNIGGAALMHPVQETEDEAPSETIGSEFQSIAFRLSPSTAAPSSAASSTDFGGLKSGGPFETPPAPEFGPREKEKMCPYCCLVYPVKTFSSHSAQKTSRRWRKHLLEDLQPYICLFQNCDQHGKTYRSFKDWQAHLSEPHDQPLLCSLHPKPDSAEQSLFFDTAELFQEHLNLHHPDIDQSTSAEIVHKSRQPSTLPNWCFVCLSEQPSDITLQKHLANHLEQAFLLALPSRNDIKASDMVSSGRPSDRTGQTDTAAPQEIDLIDLTGLYENENDSIAAEPQKLSVTDFASRLSSIDHDSRLTLDGGNLVDKWTTELAEPHDFIDIDDGPRLSKDWRILLLVVHIGVHWRVRSNTSNLSRKPGRPRIDAMLYLLRNDMKANSWHPGAPWPGKAVQEPEIWVNDTNPAWRELAIHAMGRQSSISRNNMEKMATLIDGQPLSVQNAALYYLDSRADVPSEIAELVAQVKRKHSLLDNSQQDTKDREHDAVRRWLMPLHFDGRRHHDISASRQRGTCQWFLDSREFNSWMQHERETTMLCLGIPGSGKTFLASAVIDHLNMRYRYSEDCGIAYVYFNCFEMRSVQDYLSSLLAQLTQPLPRLPSSVMTLYNLHKNKESQLQYEQLTHALQSVFSIYNSVYIIVDALDECSNDDMALSKLLSSIFDRPKGPKVKVFATSRVQSAAMNAFSKGRILEIRASDEDIARYIEEHLPKRVELVRQDPVLLQEIKDQILQSSQGMFSLGPFFLKQLKSRAFLGHSLKGRLRNIATTEVLEPVWKAVMERVNSQSSHHQALARKILLWVSHARRPLTESELRQACAINEPLQELDKANIQSIRNLISACIGLVKVDERGILHLCHFSALKYLENLLGNHHAHIADACMIYLSSKDFESGPCSTDFDLEERLKSNPFYDYAAHNWGHHVREGGESTEVASFVQDKPKFEAACQALKLPPRKEVMIWGRKEKPVMWIAPLHLAVYFDLKDLTRYLLSSATDPDVSDSWGQTPLHYAAGNKNPVIAEILCKTARVYVNSRTVDGETPLWIAAEKGHDMAGRVFIDHGADVNVPNADGFQPLWIAAEGGHSVMVELLISHGADVNAGTKIDPAALLVATKEGFFDSKYVGGSTALIAAAGEGKIDVVEILIGKGADVNLKDNSGRTALIAAASHRNIDMAKMLISEGADVNLKDNNGTTALIAATSHRNIDMAKLLISEGADVNLKDITGQTALIAAASYGYEAVARLLTDYGADINLITFLGETALFESSTKGHLGISQHLMERGANINAKDKQGRTALHAAANQGYGQIVQQLVGYGAHVNELSDQGKTPLHEAAGKGNFPVVQALIRLGADINATDHQGNTPLDEAASNDHMRVVELLRYPQYEFL